VRLIVAYESTADHRLLPGILVIDFGNRDIELAMKAMDQWFETSAFLSMMCNQEDGGAGLASQRS
jgi:hypothetical protein